MSAMSGQSGLLALRTALRRKTRAESTVKADFWKENDRKSKAALLLARPCFSSLNLMTSTLPNKPEGAARACLGLNLMTLARPQRPFLVRLGRFRLPYGALENDRSVIFLGAGLADRHGDQRPSRLGPAVEDRLDRSQLGHLEPAARQTDGRPRAVLPAVDGKGILPGFFRLELGITEGAGDPEEVQVRLPQVLVDGTQGLTVHLFQEGRFLFIMGGSRDVLQIRSRIEFAGIGQHFVPQIPAAGKGFVHQLGLFRRGVEAEFVDGVSDLAAVSGAALAIFRHGFPSLLVADRLYTIWP